MGQHQTFPFGMERRARGAVSNDAGRFERHARHFEADGWEVQEEAPLRTSTTIEVPRRMVSYNRSPDLPFDRSINPYRGCEHGCIYCFARPTHAWLGLSAGLDFETRLIARPEAPEVLARELRHRAYTPRTIAIGTNTDPYQPIEKKHEIMRACLKVLRDFRHPVAIVTKGMLIERDIDILSDMARKGLVRVGISVTTLDAELSRKLEPRAPAPQRRLAIIRALSDAGIETRIMTSPIIPGLTDHEVESLLKAGRDAGAIAASWIMLRLPLEVAPLFREWLEAQYPDRAARVMGHVRDMQGGKDYDSTFGTRMRGTGPYAQMIAQRFDAALRRYDYARKLPDLRCDLFRLPARTGDQLSLF
ncbi:PA0069 family radical SAM protein [Roseovarius sp. S4756]|uniref:PA0069 family radical SAM protein n=1 Tax=Roseovarius maritimus TaxID=3342637 RepID=UPI003729CC5F